MEHESKHGHGLQTPTRASEIHLREIDAALLAHAIEVLRQPFSEDFGVVVSKNHRFAARESIEFAELAEECLLARTYCETAPELDRILKSRNLAMLHSHKMVWEHDLVDLIDANLGVGILPRSGPTRQSLRRISINGLDLTWTVYLYAVAGRQRSPAAQTLIRMLRAADWSGHGSSEPLPLKRAS